MTLPSLLKGYIMLNSLFFNYAELDDAVFFEFFCIVAFHLRQSFSMSENANSVNKTPDKTFLVQNVFLKCFVDRGAIPILYSYFDIAEVHDSTMTAIAASRCNGVFCFAKLCFD